MAVLVVMMLCLMPRRSFERKAQATNEEAQADDEHNRAGDEAEDRKEFFRHDRPRSEERHESERENAERVRDCDRQAEEDGVTGSAS